MSDEELAAMPYADLWLAELGDTCPEAVGGFAPPRSGRPNELECATGDPGRTPARE